MLVISLLSNIKKLLNLLCRGHLWIITRNISVDLNKYVISSVVRELLSLG